MPRWEEKVAELRELPKALRGFLDGFGPRLWKVRPAAGGFSLTEQICHLRDLEQEGYLLRIQRMLQEDCPELTEFDGAKVAEQRNYLAQDPQEALKAFEETRNSTLSLLLSLKEGQLQRTGRFGTFGEISIEQLVDMMLEHDRSHIQELHDLRAE